MNVTQKNLEEYLGRKRYNFQMKNPQPEVGIVRGLAWTSVGGDTLQIEVNIMPGRGGFKLYRTAGRCHERVRGGWGNQLHPLRGQEIRD